MESISLPASIEAITQINEVIESSMQNIPAPILLKTQLVVEELFANVCNYAYDGKAGAANFVCGKVNFDGQTAYMIQITDEGKPYDPFASAIEPDLNASVDARVIGGLGIHLVKEIAKHYTYMRVNDKNQIQIIFEIPQENQN